MDVSKFNLLMYCIVLANWRSNSVEVSEVGVLGPTNCLQFRLFGGNGGGMCDCNVHAWQS